MVSPISRLSCAKSSIRRSLSLARSAILQPYSSTLLTRCVEP